VFESKLVQAGKVGGHFGYLLSRLVVGGDELLLKVSSESWYKYARKLEVLSLVKQVHEQAMIAIGKMIQWLPPRRLWLFFPFLGTAHGGEHSGGRREKGG
jgi:hypothetical protein